MGGSIFPGTVRLSLSAYKAFRAHVLQALSSCPIGGGPLDRWPQPSFPLTALAVPPYLSPKDSFGDLDVIAGADGWAYAKDGRASWEQGSPAVVEDGVGGRTHDWATRLGATRWNRSGPIISFAVPLDTFIHSPDTSAPVASSSSPALAQVDLILVPSPVHVALETIILSYSGLGILLSRPIRALTHRQLVWSHASLTLSHDFPLPALFGTSVTVPLPPLEMALSCDVRDLCTALGLDHSWWTQHAVGDRKVSHDEVFDWIMGVDGGLIRRGWDMVLAENDIVEVVPAAAPVDGASTPTPPFLDLVKRDPSQNARPMNSKQRAKLKVPLYQAFLTWLRDRPETLLTSTSSPTVFPDPPVAFHRLDPGTYSILNILPSREPSRSLADKYLALLATHEQENDALIRRRRTNLALSGTKVQAWFPEVPFEKLSSVVNGVREEVGEGWLGDEGRTEEEVKEVVRRVWEKVQTNSG